MFTESNDKHSHDTRYVSTISITNKNEHLGGYVYDIIHQKYLSKRLNV